MFTFILFVHLLPMVYNVSCSIWNLFDLLVFNGNFGNSLITFQTSSPVSQTTLRHNAELQIIIQPCGVLLLKFGRWGVKNTLMNFEELFLEKFWKYGNRCLYNIAKQTNKCNIELNQVLGKCWGYFYLISNTRSIYWKLMSITHLWENIRTSPPPSPHTLGFSTLKTKSSGSTLTYGFWTDIKSMCSVRSIPR